MLLTRFHAYSKNRLNSQSVLKILLGEWKSLNPEHCSGLDPTGLHSQKMVMNSRKILLVWRIWDQMQKLPPKFRANVLHCCSWASEVAGVRLSGHTMATPLCGHPAKMGCRGRGACGLRPIPTCTQGRDHSLRNTRMPQVLCSLTAELCLVKSMHILQLISGVAAVGCMVSSISCFSTHLILSILAAWLKSMVQFRYSQWVMFLSILVNWGLNERC